MSTPNSRDFILKVQNTWIQWMDVLETIEALDCEETPQSLTILLPSPHHDGSNSPDWSKRPTYLFNQHAGLEQLWMSSPISGGRHFICHPEEQNADTHNLHRVMFFNWVDTRNGEIIEHVLNQELQRYWGIELQLNHRHKIPEAASMRLRAD